MNSRVWNLLIAVLIPVLTLLLACKRKDPSPVTNDSRLQGKWTWVKSCGGLMGRCNPADRSRIIEFRANKEYMEYENGNHMHHSQYIITTGKSIYTSEPEPLIHYSTSSISHSFRFSADTLKLREEVYDGFEHYYVKEVSSSNPR